MSDIVKLFESLIKHRCLSTDNTVFQLHYRLTTIILIFSCILVSSKQFFGEPIKCLLNNNEVSELHDIYCWIHGTYTFRNQNNSMILAFSYQIDVIVWTDSSTTILAKISGENKISEGVGVSSHGDEKYYHTYYQWVYVILIIQAMMIYIPRFLWNIFEGGRIQSLTNEMGTLKKTPWDYNIPTMTLCIFSRGCSHNTGKI